MKPATENDEARYTKEELYQLCMEATLNGTKTLDGSKLNRAELILLCNIISDELKKIHKIFDDLLAKAPPIDIEMTDKSVGGFQLAELSIVASNSGGGRSRTNPRNTQEI